jgi:hypothetical protein
MSRFRLSPVTILPTTGGTLAVSRSLARYDALTVFDRLLKVVKMIAYLIADVIRILDLESVVKRKPLGRRLQGSETASPQTELV